MKRIVLAVALLFTVRPSFAQPPKAKTGASPTANQLWAGLESGNRRFVLGHPSQHDEVAARKALTRAQAPKVAVLACSDSRDPPELLFDQGLGDLFVVRNAGNTPDPIAIGSLEYAVEHLGSTVIVVLGHQRCGAVTAACSREKMPSPNLEAVVAPIAPSCAAGKQESSADLSAAIKDHVHRSAEQLVSQSPLLSRAIDEGKLKIIEAYYELDTGKVVRLKE